MAATLLLAINAPIQFDFQLYAAETISTSLVGSALVAGGIFRRSRRLFGVGNLLLVTLVSLCVWTQPMQLEQSIRTFWPLRLAVPLTLSLVWTFLLSPPVWLRCTLLAIAIPTGSLLLAISQTATIPLASGARKDISPNFAPYWLAIDHQGTLYASSATGNAIMVFDAVGRPQGTIWPAQSLVQSTQGPGIIPAGSGTIVAALNALTLPTPIPSPGFHDADADTALFWFYGLAVDTQDRLYMVDRHIPGSASVIQINRNGNLTARWSLPHNFTAAIGSLTTDSRYMYLSSGFGQIFVFNYDGTLRKTLKLPYQPVSIAATGQGQLMFIGQHSLDRVDVDTEAINTVPLPSPAGELQTPYQALAVTAMGKILVADQGRSQVLMIDPQDGQVVQTIGRAGSWPGQFASLGGIAQDQAGRIYIADPQHRVVQRFLSTGRLDAIWSAHESIGNAAKR